MKPSGEYRFGPIPNTDPPTAEAKREVGRFTLSIPTVIATALITAATTITCTWMSMRHAPPEGVQQQLEQCLTKADFTEAMRVNELRDRDWREHIQTDLSEIKGTVDRLKERVK